MAISSITGNPLSTSQVSSAYGSAAWYSGSLNFVTYLNAGGGAGWIIFQIQSASIPGAEAFNGIRVQGVHDFLVGGGAGVGRSATGYWAILGSVAAFIGAAGDGSLGSVNGSGVGQNLNFVATKGGFTSTNIVNGTMYLGFSVVSDNGDPGMGTGVYRNSCINFTTYTGTDVPSPPITAINGVIGNPIANVTPGKLPGGQLEALTFTYTQLIPQANIQFRWTLPAGMLWASNSNVLLTQSKGTTGDPGSPYFGSTGVANINAAMAPGTYSVELLVTCVGLTDFHAWIPITVASPPRGFIYEF